MGKPLSAAQQARNDLGGATRRGDPDAVAQARAALRTAVLEASIREAVAAWPPLSVETRSGLAVLLLSAGDGHAAT